MYKNTRETSLTLSSQAEDLTWFHDWTILFAETFMWAWEDMNKKFNFFKKEKSYNGLDK